MSNPLRKVKLNKIFYFYYLFFKPNLKRGVLQFYFVCSLFNSGFQTIGF